MSCTCFQRKYPCPVHGEKGRLEQIPEYEENMFVMRIHVKWTDDDKKTYYTTVAKDAIRTFTSAVFIERDDAITAAFNHIKPLTADKVVAKL